MHRAPLLISAGLITAAALVIPTTAHAAPAEPTASATPVYANVSKGQCAPGAVKTKMAKAQKVTWQWKNGNISKKTVKKGKTVCKFTNAGGQTATAPTNAAGVMTSLPSSFPKNPTAADIAKLGLTPDSKVAPNLRIPQPTGAPLAKGELPDTVRPIASTGQPVKVNIYAGDDEMAPRYVDKVDVTWRFTGGSGVLRYTTTNLTTGVPETRYVELVPQGYVDVVANVSVRDATNGNVADFWGEIQPNYGQSKVPASMVEDWKTDYVKDESGRGRPVGQNANTAYFDDSKGVGADGWVRLDTSGNLVGDYTYR